MRFLQAVSNVNLSVAGVLAMFVERCDGCADIVKKKIVCTHGVTMY